MPARGTTGLYMVPSATVLAQAFFVTAEKLSQIEEPMHRIVNDVLVPEIEENFQTEGHGAWEQLAPATALKRGSAHPILMETGQMREAATSPQAWSVERSGSSAFASFNPDVTEYAKFHISGTSFMPVRDFGTFEADVEDQVEDIFDEWLDEAIDAGIGAL